MGLSIPPQFQAEGFRFVKLGSSGEALKKPVEYFWDCLTLEEARRQYAEELAAASGDKSKSKRLQAGEPSRLTNYGVDDPALLQRLQRGGNYGVVNGTGPNGAGLATLDADNLPRLAELVDLASLPPTMEAGRRGEDGEPIQDRRHFHFLSDLEGKHRLKDPETGEVLGDVRGSGGFQVVGPGSLHPSGAVVEVLEDRPLAEISGAELLRILSPALEASSPLKLETGRAKLEGLRGKRRPPTATDKDPFADVSILDVIDVSGFKESGGQFFGGHPVHGSETGHNLVVNSAKNSWWCGRCETGGGPALWLAVEAEIIDCSEARPGALRGERFLQTLDYAKSKGIIPDEEGEARDYLETVRDGLKADPRKLKDRDVLAALLTLRENDPVEFDILADELKAAAGWVKLPTLKKMIDREERRQADEKRARADEEGAGDGGGKGDDPGYYGFARHDFGDYDDEGKFQFSRATAAASIPTKTPMAMGAGGKDIFYFDGQIYRPQGGPLIGSVLYNVCDDGVNKNQVSEVLDRIRADLQLAPVTWNPDPCLMPLQNGVLDLRGGAFRGYQAEDRFTFQYNAKWNAEGGDWRRFIWFLCTALPDPRDVLTAIDIMTAVALRIPFDVIVQLLGGGSNGKGVFEKVLLALFTAERSTALDLEELKRSRFGAGALFDVDLWIISEVEGVKDAISALKKIATGEFTDSDTKYGGRRKGRPHAVPILDSNNAFDFGDESYGRRRRMARLDFCYTFGDGPEMRPIDRQMEESLTTPDSLAGLVQIIAARAPGLLRDRKIYNRKTTEEAAEEYRRQQYSLGYFCDECLSAKGGEREETTTVYDAYLEYCKLFKVPTPASHISLGRYISKVFGVQSVGTSEGSGDTRRDYRYYPGVHLAKPPQEAHADHLLNHPSYSSDRYPTDIRQKGGYEISICNYIPTDTTDKTLIRVLEEICRIYGFISSCEDERDITWESYHQKSVGAVVSVGDGHCITVSYPTDENLAGLSVGEPVGEGDETGPVDPPHKSIDEPREEAAGEDRQTIADELEEDRRRQAEEAARTATPSPKGDGAEYSAPKKADPPEEGDRIFDIPVSYFEELSIQTNGLTPKILMQAQKWDDHKAAMALSLLRGQGWPEDEAGRLHPAAGVVA